MMKKIIFCFIAIFAAFGTKAQQVSTPKLLDNMSIEEIVQLTQDPQKNEELLVQMLFAIPPLYHQYVMPMVADLYGVSEKTRMMPGIVEWRRKLPTRIAPQLEEFAKEHLRYLDPSLYPFLMPEMWPDPETEGHHSEFVPQVIQISSTEEMNKIFPPSIDENSFLGQLLNGTYQIKERKRKQADLTSKDVGSVITVMDKLKKLETGSKGRERRNILILDYQDTSLLIDAHVNPCQSLISHLDKIEADKWFENQVKAENMTVEEFTQKCDAVIKAYRMKLAAPGVLRAIYYDVEDAMKLPENAHRRRLSMALLHMFDTSKADIDAIKGKEAELEKTFHDKLLFLGTPVLLDF